MTHPAHLLTVAIVAAWATALVLLRSSGQAPLPPAREPCLARLNRLAAENKDLVEAVEKIVVPVTVALVALLGVLLTVIARE